MSGSRFVEMLRQINYPGVDKLDSKSFDWLFEYDETLPFLEWTCDNLQSANVLSSREIEEFKKLKQQGGGILEGEHLNKALHEVVDTGEDCSEGALREEVNLMTNKLKRSKKRKEKLIQQRNKLSLHYTGLGHKVSRLGEVEDRGKRDYSECLQQSQADNTQINRSLERLTKSVQDMTSLYNQPTQWDPSTSDGEGPMFLSQMSLDSYHNMEDKFTQALTAHTKKQFFEGIADMAGGQEDNLRLQILDAADAETLLVKGEKAHVNEENKDELERLQAVYPKSEKLRLSAQMDEAVAKALNNYADKKLSSLRENSRPQNVRQLSSSIQDLQQSVHVLNRDITPLIENDIPMLIAENAPFQVSKILHGDYDLKTARQDYFTSNQDKLISYLVEQRSRGEFLTMLYEIEARNHRDTHRLLAAVKMQLERNVKGLQDRIAMLNEPGLKQTRERETIDTRDPLNRLYDVIGPRNNESKEQLFITYSGLVNGADKLNSDITGLRASLSSANSYQDDRLTILEQNVKLCETIVYAGSATSGTQPLLSPQQLLDSSLHLEQLIDKLEANITDIATGIQEKKKLLQADPLKRIERELYTYFHNDPDRLRQTLQDISHRLQAQMVK
ncbi:unnamed protein product [Owenia fusiformis]|uniref:HAUS augmin-like complex subunit 3 N-terminal domain-containing protein n=1 Tax=Owenia fusiformis TaxID=6347 RepID=A0A8S4N1K3_OWEFU|nr:unnamed protein product [Owenia fusiformis]